MNFDSTKYENGVDINFEFFILSVTVFLFNFLIAQQVIIYGEGYKIKSSFEYIYEDTTLSYLNNPKNEFLYWGDIDKEGFIIYEVFKKSYENFNIKLFDKAYLKMIEKSKFFNLTKIKNTQKQNYKNSLDELDFKLKEEICFVIDNGNYIPQEILNLFDLTSE